ncbi:MAG: PIN domain-containing protein [Synechococcus sp.]
MQIAIDASVLVGELLRKRGRLMLQHDSLILYATEKVWEETKYEIGKRTAAIAARNLMTEEQQKRLCEAAISLGSEVLDIVPFAKLQNYLAEAAIRIPRDPLDIPTVALALLTGSDIWTLDNDFLGCGIATWTTETLYLQLKE